MAKTRRKATRGRPSKIDQLPDVVKNLLNALLRDKRYSQREVLAEVNKQITELGLPDELIISRTGLNRHASRLAKVGKKMQEVQATADAWVAKLGEKPQGDIGRILIQMTQTMAFEAAGEMAEDDEPASVGLLKDLALTVQRLEKTRTDSIKNEKEIRKAVAEDAAAALKKLGKEQGTLDTKTLDEAVKAVYGVA